jgi:opacity protein-like surface antigen
VSGDTEKDYLITQLNISILGKYPFAIGEKLQLFPLLGVDFQIAITDRDDEIAEDIKSAPGNTTAPSLGEFWNSIWIKAGIGADYSLTEALYLRCEVLYGIKFNSKYEDDEAKYWTEDIKGVKNGPDVRLGVGYRFKTFGK